MIEKKDLLLAMNGIDEKYIEESERKIKRGLKAKTSILIAAVLVLLFSVTAVAVASFSNTVNDGDLVFMEALGGYSGDNYSIRFNIDVAEDSDHLLHDYYVPMYLEGSEDWTDCGGDAGETYSVMAYDNYGENLFAIFTQYPAWNYDNGAAISYNVPAGTEVFESYFEIDGEKLYCIEFWPCDDGFRGDPFGTKEIFWSNGYNMFVLEVRLNMDAETVREIIRSIEKVENISEYVKYEEYKEE